MKELYLVLLTFYLTTTLAHYEKHRCGSNEVFVTCGSGCEATCKNPKPKACTSQCVDGCRCKTGYIRNDKSECVKQCSVAQQQPASHPYNYQRPSPPVLAPPHPQPVVVAAPPPPPPPRKPANCWDLLCPHGMMCSMVQERCRKRPCPPPVPKCVMGAPPTTTTPRPVAAIPATCSDLICPGGMICGRVKQTCKKSPCQAPTLQCMPLATTPPPKPKSCAMVSCAAGMVCEMVQDPCKQTPCPSPAPRCVVARAPQPPTSCTNLRCGTGTHCEMKAPKCSHSPCQAAVPQCVQNYVAPPPPPPRPQPIVIPVLMTGRYPH